MPGDFSRRLFDRRKHYAAILMQQGRVQLDGDWNHQAAVQQHRDETATADMIGRCGAPKEGGGFSIGVAPDGKDLTISTGTMYVDGILCALDAAAVPVSFVAQPDSVKLDSLLLDERELQGGQWVEIFAGSSPLASPPMFSPPSSPPAAHSRVYRISSVDTAQKILKLDASVAEFQTATQPLLRRVSTYTSQPDFPAPDFTTAGSPPNPPVLQLADGTYVAYLDVAQIEVNAGVDRRLREVALGGADTSVALKTVAQVRLLRVTPGGGSPPACDSMFPEWDARTASPTGRMTARTNAAQPPTDPCSLPPTSGYRRLENQLYRVQVHKGGTRAQATFKWSRENASIETAVEKVAGSVLTVSSLGRDEVLGFKGSQWIEPVDEPFEVSGTIHPLAKIDHVEDETREITLAGSSSVASAPRLRIRRWDQDPSAGDQNGIAMTAAWQDLESGIQVRFGEGTYRAGDYWTIPARVATGDIEWPPFDATLTPLPQPPEGTQHHYCRLALVTVVSAVIHAKDCRPLFPPLTHICADDVCYDNGACNMPGVQTVKDALDFLCKQKPQPGQTEDEGIHIVGVTLATGSALKNDTEIPIGSLSRGIRVLCDRDPFQNSVKDKPVCTLTLEMPFPFNPADRQLWGDAVVGFEPLILFAATDAGGKVISWIPQAPTVEFLRVLRAQMVDLRRGDRILAWLKVRGDFIWDKENPNLFIDGDAFGLASGSRTDIQFPSGDKRRGDDFNMWFWLTVRSGPLLKMARVRFLKIDPREPDARAETLAELRDPGEPVRLLPERGCNCIEFAFTGADLDFESVKLGSSFQVTPARGGSRPRVERVLQMENNIIRYVVDAFDQTVYTVQLFGDQPSPVKSVDGDRFDGEPRRLPSGDDNPGGTFAFTVDLRGR